MDFSHFINVIFKEGNYYVARCLNVDVSGFAATKREALDNLRSALELYFKDIDIQDAALIYEAEFIIV